MSNTRQQIFLTVFIVLSAVALLISVKAASSHISPDLSASSLTSNAMDCAEKNDSDGHFIVFGTDCNGVVTPPEPDPSPNLTVIKIATFGDSNTESGRWRKPFQQILRDNNCSYEMIGTKEKSWDDFGDFDKSTDAVSGATIATSLRPKNAIFLHASKTIESNEADLIFIIGGTNDLVHLPNEGSQNQAFINRVVAETREQLLETKTISTKAYYIVGGVMEIKNKPTLIQNYNAALKAMVSTLSSTMNIRFIDNITGQDNITPDLLHLTEVSGKIYGENLANKSLDIIKETGVCKP